MKKNHGREHRISVQAQQDFILFGRKFSTSFLKELSDESVVWFAEDGDLVLKGQILLNLFAETQSGEMSLFLKVLSHLSGTATLTRCYVENAGDLKIVGSASKNSPFPEWEQKALEAGGGVTNISCVPCLSEKSLFSTLKRKPKAVALDMSLFSTPNGRQMIKEIPREIKRGVCGRICPGDLIKLLNYPLDFVMPSFLQGGFSSVKMTVSKEPDFIPPSDRKKTEKDRLSL